MSRKQCTGHSCTLFPASQDKPYSVQHEALSCMKVLAETICRRYDYCSGLLCRAATTKTSAMETHYYLAKSEPETRLEQGVDISFPLSRLASSSTKRTTWEGVRNPVAGKNLKNMRVGDRLLFYHSNCKLPGVAGEVEVCTEPRPDETAWDSVSGRESGSEPSKGVAKRC